MVLDDFLNNEIQEFLGKRRVQIGLCCKCCEPRNLRCFARRVGRRKVVFSLKHPYRLGMLEAFPERVDEDRVEAVNAFAVPCKKGCGAGFIRCHMCGTFGASGRGYR